MPLSIGILAPESDELLTDERRASATMPGIPRTVDDWRALPGKIDAQLRDHFGLRRAMIRAHSILTRRILHTGNAQVQIGKDEWLFYRDNNMLQQSAGLLVRESRVIESAETIASIKATLSWRGIKFIVALPPNSSTIYSDMLPQWARNRGQQTEYDLMLVALADRDIQAVDLRPPLRNARASGKVYFQYDTHWNARGAVAAFNAVASAAGHAGWQLDPAMVLTPATQTSGGDLARMLGIAQDVAEQTEALTLTTEAPKSPGTPIILVLGDSFTRTLFSPMVIVNGGQFAFANHEFCDFDWKWIEKIHPDEVWWMPTERLLLCNPGTIPESMPAANQSVE